VFLAGTVAEGVFKGLAAQLEGKAGTGSHKGSRSRAKDDEQFRRLQQNAIVRMFRGHGIAAQNRADDDDEADED